MRLPWQPPIRDDPYWEAFINRPPSDPNNLLTRAFQSVKLGGVNPARGEIHSPDVMARHVKELGRFFGAEQVGIVGLISDLPFAIVCSVRSEYDTRLAPGFGGQAPALKGLFVAFNLSAWIKEMGFQAVRSADAAERLAVLAGLGAAGRRRHIAEVVYTDLPLQPDARDSGPA